MALTPNIQRKAKFTLKQCSICHQSFGPESFAPTKSIFYPDGAIPICNDCVEQILGNGVYNWEIIDKVCQMCDIPFIPAEWNRLFEMDSHDVFYRYATIFLSSEYDGIGWGDYYEAFKKLKEEGNLEEQLPGLADDKRKKLKEKWGANYDDEALNYLETLFQGLITTQNVNGALQIDQALKICKMSYEIDCRIREGGEFDKLLGSYDKLVKAAEFTPKNVKNINDFDTFGEATKWMEKRGWRNKFYDNVTRDIVDESMKNFQAFNQRLYTNESAIPDEIARRLEALKTTAKMENYYETNQDYDLDAFEQDGYDALLHEAAEEDFVADVEDAADAEE